MLFVGRHEERKGLRVLLEAVSMLPADLHVWIAGDGPESAALRSTYAGDPRLEWLGAIGEEEKIARLRGADVFVAPSLHGESFGVVLLEGMAARTPVVASDIPGYANAARQGRDAKLFPAGDAPALAAAIASVLDDSATRAALVQSGLERAEEFSMARLADLYVARYERIAG
ncbi:MAG: glycosyltransferase [Acidimicrobiales bacterium]